MRHAATTLTHPAGDSSQFHFIPSEDAREFVDGRDIRVLQQIVHDLPDISRDFQYCRVVIRGRPVQDPGHNPLPHLVVELVERT